MYPMCMICKNLFRFSSISSCIAFPNGIPKDILSGKVLHNKSVDGDNGIKFEQSNNMVKENSLGVDDIVQETFDNFIKTKCKKIDNGKYECDSIDIVKVAPMTWKSVRKSDIDEFKLNYKCKKGTKNPDTNECLDEKTTVETFRNKSHELIYSDKKYINSLKSYVTNSYEMNSILRSTPDNEQPSDENIKTITKLLNKQNIPENTILFRGISPEQWDKIPTTPGTIYLDKNFVSTTLDKKIAIGFGRYRMSQDTKYLKSIDNEYSKTGRVDWNKTKPYLLEVKVNKNAKGLLIESVIEKEFPDSKWAVGKDGEFHSAGNQQEVLLQRGQKFRVLGVKEHSNHIRLVVETFDGE